MSGYFKGFLSREAWQLSRDVIGMCFMTCRKQFSYTFQLISGPFNRLESISLQRHESPGRVYFFINNKLSQIAVHGLSSSNNNLRQMNWTELLLFEERFATKFPNSRHKIKLIVLYKGLYYNKKRSLNHVNFLCQIPLRQLNGQSAIFTHC
jgi:hypothetical protein